MILLFLYIIIHIIYNIRYFHNIDLNRIMILSQILNIVFIFFDQKQQFPISISQTDRCLLQEHFSFFFVLLCIFKLKLQSQLMSNMGEELLVGLALPYIKIDIIKSFKFMKSLICLLGVKKKNFGFRTVINYFSTYDEY